MPRAYSKTFYQTCGTPDGSLSAIPLRRWCEENYYSRAQALTLLKKGYLLGVTFRGKLYVCKNPDCDLPIKKGETR